MKSKMIVMMCGKPGTHCAICGKPIKGKSYPGADVYHWDCIYEATRHLRDEKDDTH